MLLVLDQTVADVFSTPGPKPQSLIDALEILGSQIYHGEHALFTPRHIAEILLEKGPGDRRLKLVLKAARDQYSDRQRLYSRVAVHAEIKTSLLPTPVQTVVGDRTVIEIPLTWIDHPDKLRRTALLGEDQSDVQVFREIARAITPADYWRAATPSYEPIHGGGGAIGAVFSNLRNQNRFICCIVDSDRAWPGAVLGGTAQQIAAHFQPSPPPLAAWAYTDGRDLENALPDAFYLATYANPAQQRVAVKALEALTGSADEPIRSYVDISDGMTLEDVYSLPIGNIGRQFWDQAWPILAQLQTLPAAACGGTGICSKPPAQIGQSQKCVCRFFPPFHKAVLDSFASYAGRLKGGALLGQLSLSLQNEWTRFGKLVFDWCCANKPRPV